MQLLSADQADDLYAAMGPAREISGGSAANSMAGAAALGLDVAFIGQVADDQLGDIFAHDMRSLGVRFETPPITSPPPTGRCLILVTPDAQRTMNTCPGASHELTPAALDRELIRSASVTFLEGYLWGPERPRAAMLEAANIAHSAGRTVAFTLSESLCIGDRRQGVRGMIEAGTVDILFGNEDEVRHLTGCGDLADCISALSGSVPTLVITRGPGARLRSTTASAPRSPQRPSAKWSTPPARATCSPPAFLPDASAAVGSSNAWKPARSPQPKSSPTSAHGPKPTSESSRSCEPREAPRGLLRLGRRRSTRCSPKPRERPRRRC